MATSEAADGRPIAVFMAGVSFSYDGEPVLENVNLSIKAHDFVAVVGPNGGGKTTLLKLMLGLIRPQKGRVLVMGREPAEVRPLMGYLPQHAHTDPAFPVSVLDVVLMGRLGKKGAGGRLADRRAARQALAQVNLEGLAARPFAALSGGQRQRVLVARALASEPEVILLDEPTANVDPSAGGEIYELLHLLREKMTVVAVTHDLGFVSCYVGQVICVNRKVTTHPTHEVTGQVINEVYGYPMRMVRHDHKGLPEDSSCV
jgi:zinc transport system ATP-binding protein